MVRDFPLMGRFVLAEEGGALRHIFPVGRNDTSNWTEGETPLLAEAARQMEEYLRGERREFDLLLCPKGTPWQQRIWTFLQQIPYGETVTYAQCAAAAGKPKGAQAAGQAVGANPLPIVIPCHRVVGKNGTLTGFALGLDLKEQLLRLERRE